MPKALPATWQSDGRIGVIPWLEIGPGPSRSVPPIQPGDCSRWDNCQPLDSCGFQVLPDLFVTDSFPIGDGPKAVAVFPCLGNTLDSLVSSLSDRIGIVMSAGIV